MKHYFTLLNCILICLYSVVLQAAHPTKHNVVVTEQHLASDVGIQILRAGGNAFDAAVAIGYALAVVDPCCGNIGGGGFMTAHLANGKNVFINFRERAPLNAFPDLFLDTKKNVISNKSLAGYLAVATPGTVMGLEAILKQYGTMTRQQVMQPAIQLAKKGFVLTKGDIQILAKNTEDFRKEPNVAAIFLKNNRPYQEGERLIQTDLANTLQLIADKGETAFYHGPIAAAVVQASQKHGGILTQKDFNEYYIEKISPIYCTYRGYTIVTAPPPSGGGVPLCEMLNILEGFPLNSLGYQSLQSISYIVEAMRHAYIDRNTQLGDPHFVNNPVERLISKDYAKKVREKFFNNKITTKKIVDHEGVYTTHYSVLDKQGNAVSITYTINSYFGAKVIAGKTGFFLNNEMDDFAIKLGFKNQFGLVQGVNNKIQPGKRPLSAMAPTIVLKNNHIVMITGSPGGSRIPTSVLLTLLNVIDYGKNIQDAVNSPRFHHQGWPDIIEAERDTFLPLTQSKLKNMGYQIQIRDPWGAVESIYINPVTKLSQGANDKRRPAGKAVDDIPLEN